MVEVLNEYCRVVAASDIVLHALDGGGTTAQLGIEEYDFLSGGLYSFDWIITNPPFSSAELFLEPALKCARKGVAFFERAQWLEGVGRYERCFAPRPPTLIAPFSERVPLCEGGYDPDGSTATWYAWFVWKKNVNGYLKGPLWPEDTIPAFLIPPGCAKALFKPSDLELAKRCVPGFVPPSKKRKDKKRKAKAAATRLEEAAA